MRVSSVEVNLLELPLTEPFAASHGRTVERTIVMVRLISDIGWGWGECSALPTASYTSESAATSFHNLARDLAPRLVGREIGPDNVAGLLEDFAEQPMARSALEMATIDAQLRSEGRSLAQWLGVTVADVTAGVSIGLDTVQATVGKARAMADEGYRRFKVKIEPGHDHQLVAAIRRDLPDVELQVDANGAYHAEDTDHLLQLVELGVDAVEQPFPADQPQAAAELIRRLDTGRSVPVVADEAVSSQSQAEVLMAAGAMTGLSIKPARVGGFVAARRLHDLCLANGLAATAGGMLESGLGRHGLAALAGLPGFNLTGDLSPARRWLAADPWPDLEMSGGRITVPTGPGIAPDPDPELLDQYRLAQELVDDDRA